MDDKKSSPRPTTKLRALITCNACHTFLVLPKVLPCSHTFCKTCIYSLLDTSISENIHCPSCSDEIVVPDRDPERLMTNFHLSELAEMFNVNTCSVCQLRGTSCAASHVCLDCGDQLCATCSAGHHASRATVSHQVITIQQLDTGDYDAELLAKMKVHCFHHNEKECAFYCKTCRQPVCSQCAMLDHRDHELSSLTDSAQCTANGIIENCNSNTEKLHNLYLITRTRYNKALERKQNAFSDIEIATEDLYQYLLSRKEEALKTLEKTFADELSSYSVLIKDIDDAKARAKALTSSIETLSQTETGVFHIAQTLHCAAESIGDTYTRLEGRDICPKNISVEGRKEIFEVLNGPIFKLTESSAPNTVDVTSLGQHISGSEISICSTLSDHDSPGMSGASSRLSLSNLAERPTSTSWETTFMTNSHVHFVDETSVPLSSAQNTFARMKFPLHNLRLLDPPSIGNKINGSPPSNAGVVNLSPSCDNSAAELGFLRDRNPNSKISLTLRHKISVAVKKDQVTPKIHGMSLFGSNRIVLTDGANNKVKSFLKDGTPNSASVERFSDQGHKPASIIAVGDYICFTVHKSVLIVNKNFQTIADVRLQPYCVSPNGKFSYPIWRFDNESFMVGNLKENKEWHIKTNGDILQILQSPAKAPVVAVGHDGDNNFLYSSWSQPGSVIVVTKNFHRVRTLQPKHESGEWYPGYSSGDTQGNVFVADTRQRRIVVFNYLGQHMLNIRPQGNIRIQPRCLLVEDDDTMLLSGERDCVYVYNIMRL